MRPGGEVSKAMQRVEQILNVLTANVEATSPEPNSSDQQVLSCAGGLAGV